MFQLLNFILSIVILIRLYKYDKFYIISYDMKLKEYDKHDRRENKKNNKRADL